MIVALVDANNFYVSCERVFNPRLVGRPVVVLSNNDGCIVARSNEAKAMGIGMGVPLFKVRSLINAHDVQVYSSNYTLYGDMSRRVMETLFHFTPDIEIYSIDEAFLNLSGSCRDDWADYGRRIRSAVRQWTGIPVSVGIARTKTLAKIANHLAKKSPRTAGVLDLTNTDHRLEEALTRTKVQDVWGIGSGFTQYLDRAGIATAAQLRDADEKWVQKHMGVTGLRTVYELRGLPCYEMEMSPPLRKGIAVSRSFGRPITTLDELSEAMAAYVTRAAEKLRQRNLAAGQMSVYAMTNLFREKQHHYFNCDAIPLPVATSDTAELIHYALKGIRKIYRPNCRFKKAGILLDQLVPADQVQANLFDTVDRRRSEKLMRTLDQINARLSCPLHYAAAGITRPWQTRFQKRSNRYTTCWSELPQAKTG